MLAEGIIPALVTPFDEQGVVDLHALRRLVRRLIDAGVHGLFVVGNAGEFFNLSSAEKEQILRTVLQEAGGTVPVYFGSGAISTEETIQLTKTAESLGANAVSILTPYFVRLNEDELYEHYYRIAQATRLPILIYSNPSLTGNIVSARLVRRLIELDNIIGIKDSSGDLALAQEYLDVDPAFSVLAGRDGLILATLAYGGSGAISSVANIAPEILVQMYTSYEEGRWQEALEAQQRVARIRRAFQLGTFPSVIKAALRLQGYDAGNPRSPIRPLGQDGIKSLRKVLCESEVL